MALMGNCEVRAGRSDHVVIHGESPATTERKTIMAQHTTRKAGKDAKQETQRRREIRRQKYGK